MTAREIVNALSFDVEEYFHALNFRRVKESNGHPLETRVEVGTDRVLDLLARTSTRATFFILGEVAKDHPVLVRRIAEAGHEVASHGISHRTVQELGSEGFRREAADSRKLLEDLAGRPVLGFRASTFSIIEETLWALDILWEEGYQYDSSIFPVYHDRYGIPWFSRAPVRVCTGETIGGLEIPPLTLALPGLNVPFGGGGYFRLFPFFLTRWAVRRMNGAGLPALFYLHPWEFDPEQPRHDLGGLNTFRHYVNLGRTSARLEALVRGFAFETLAALASQSERWGELSLKGRG
jgi:polysaccharide deacetylase family protein (PEP-CTERM system associated)